MKITINGEKYVVERHQEAYLKILGFIYEKYPQALNLFEQLSKHGEKGKRYLASSKDKLYPNNPKLANKGRPFQDKWYIPGNIGPKTLNRIIRLFSQIIEDEYSEKLMINIGD